MAGTNVSRNAAKMPGMVSGRITRMNAATLFAYRSPRRLEQPRSIRSSATYSGSAVNGR